ncbi:MAG: hypothetical protein WCR63_03920 [Bacilli bacterium]
MKVNIKIDEKIAETNVTISAPKMTKEVENSVSIINNASASNLVCYKSNLVYFIVCLLNYLQSKANIKKINDKLRDK